MDLGFDATLSGIEYLEIRSLAIKLIATEEGEVMR